MLLTGLFDGVNQNLGVGLNSGESASIVAKIQSLTTAAALCSAMGLDVGTNPPTEIFTFRESALPIIAQLNTPTNDLDTAVGTGPDAFQVAGGAPLTLDLGVRTLDSANYARCSATSELDVAVQSVVHLQVCYVDTTPALQRSWAGKKGGGGATNAGYAMGALASVKAGSRISDGTTQQTHDSGVAWPTGWAIGMGRADRANLLTGFYCSFASQTQATLTVLGSYSNAVHYRMVGAQAQNSPAITTFLEAVWIGANAEGFGQAAVDSLQSYLGI